MTICPSCKAQNPDDNVFCANCGKPLKADATTPLRTPTAPSAAEVDLSGLATISGDDTKDRRWRQSEDTALDAGTVFGGRYTIESVIGRGGMGVVYRAKDSVGDRAVALKLIRSDLLGGEPAVKRLIAEGVLTQDIRHKNVVNVYNVGQEDGQPFVAMELADGKSLREWLRQQVTARTEVPLRIAARIIAEVLDGLDAAHSMGIVHRDLKPENIILTADPTDKAAPLKILDFGIARAAGKMESGTGTGLGTPRYMAPEQITNPDAAGPSADLYSVSVIFYELLVDVLPQGHWQPPSGGRADVSPRIDDLIERGLSNRPASRPQTAKGYRQQLVDAVNNSVPAPAPRPAPVPAPVRLYDNGGGGVSFFKQPWFKWVAIVVGVLIVIGGIQQIIQGAQESNGGGGSSSSSDTSLVEHDNPPAPNPPAPSNSYAALNGQWIDDGNGVYTMSVAPDGSFAGSGTTGNGLSITLSGRFNGNQGTIAMTGPLGPSSGQVEWDGHDCHVLYSMFANGGQGPSGKFHINHRPNEPCP